MPIRKKAAVKKSPAKKPNSAKKVGRVSKRGTSGVRPRGKPAVTGSNPDEYYAALPADLRELAERLRRLVKDAAPRASEAIKWGMPVFEQRGMLCYICGNDGYVRLGFYKQGVYLSDPDGLLEGTGEAMRHVKVRSLRDMRDGLFSAWVKRAVAINEDA